MPFLSTQHHPSGHALVDRRRRLGHRAGTAVAAAVCLLASLALPAAVASADTGSAATSSVATPVAHTSAISAYWLVASDGGIFSFGGAPFYGSTGNIHLNKPIVGMAASANGGGYWLVASDGGIFSFGTAPFLGSMGGSHLNQPIVGMAAAPNNAGYWLVASDGGIFAFGNAPFYGSMGGSHLNQPIVGMAATPDGGGYWMVAADGGIFSFGDAHFYGSTGNIHLNQPIVGMTATATGNGYWFTASDGGVFAFGDAAFDGSLGDVPQSRPIVAITSTGDGGGYWFANNNGAVSAYGDATYWGSAPQVLNRPIVGMAEVAGSGNFTGSSYPSGSFGYDIANYQCPGTQNGLPPSPHTVGVVEVVGGSKAAVNRCLAAEAAWAGGGLNLYVYLTNGVDATSADPACAFTGSQPACNFGFNTALDAFAKAQAAGVNTSVAWWLDVEDNTLKNQTSASSALVQGAIDGLHYEGLNGVGIYASPALWKTIVGSYTPAVPYWAADWGPNPTQTCQNVKSLFSGLPTGPVQLVQYSSPSFPTPYGGMSTTYDDDYAC